MKHENHMTDADRADLETAANMMAPGRKLRRQVLARLRARAFRQRRKTGEIE